MKSQNEIVLTALKQGKVITAIWAEKKHIHRVGARICDLRRAGHPVVTTIRKRPNKLTGRISRYAAYSLEEL